MELRPYQTKAIDSLRQAITKDDMALAQLATGAGKTVIFTHIVKLSLEKKGNFKTLILVNKNVLIPQTIDKFPLGSPVGIYSAGMGEKNLFNPVTVASVQSLALAKSLPPVDLIIVDEVHSLSLDRGQGKKVYDRLFRQDGGKPKVLGFTATDFDAKGFPIYGDKFFFKKVPCFSKSMLDLTIEGYLSPLIFASQDDKSKIDLEGVKKSGGDFVVSDLEKRLLKNEKKIYLQCQDIIARTEKRKKVAIMCVSIKHCELVSRIFNELGHAIATIHSKQSEADKAINEKRFIHGNTKFAVSVMMLTTGWDFPALEALAICRPTRSKVLFVQMCGRVARLFPGKENGLVLDYGDIVPNLGFPYDIKASTKKPKDPSIKVCIHCDGYNQTSASKCVICSEVFMVMCDTCLKMKPYGETCICGGKKVKRDMYKNLSSSVSSRTKVYNVKSVEIYTHLAKSGRLLPAVKYHTIESYYPIVDYCFKYSNIDILKRVFRKPSKIYVEKDSNGFNKIVRREYARKM